MRNRVTAIITRMTVPLLIILPLCGVILPAGCSPSSTDASSSATPTTTAILMDLRLTVRASGEIRATRSERIIPDIKRPCTIEFIVPEGQRITNGEVVARFNTEELDRTLKEAEGKLADQTVKMISTQTELDIQKMENNASLRTAEIGVQSAERELEKLLQGTMPLEIRTAKVKKETASRELDRQQKKTQEIESLLAEGFVTADQVEEERIALDQARIDSETAAAELDMLTRYTLPLDEAKARNTLATAQTALEKQQKNAESLTRQKQQAVEVARLTAERTTNDIVLLRKELAECIVKSPTDGIVTYADPSMPWRRGEVQVGSKISAGQVLMTIPNMGEMKAVVNVPEADIQRVATNQPVIVTIEAASRNGVTGSVIKVAEVANAQGWWSADVKEFATEVSFLNPPPLKPGLSCSAEILTGILTNALCIPSQAIFRKDNLFIVYVAGPGSAPRETPVRLGASSESMVQVLDGLRPGDRVCLSKPATESQHP
jgi:RND family efflux transporter MFP subunit